MGALPRWNIPPGENAPSAPEGTTVLALRYQGGVVMAGDRRATEGHLVAHRRIRKVFPADRYSAVAIAGTAGLAIDMVRLFQVELEHYEKIEGVRLSLEGKASFLARLVRNQLPMAIQGLVVVPMFAGYSEADQTGRLFSFDVVGGRYEEIDFGSTGSGSRLAKSYLRTVYRDDLSADEAADLAVRALVSASQEDTATGGPDLRRGIYPNVLRIDEDGLVELPDDVVGPLAEGAVETIR
ncbi:MAG: proteasome subunit beta [Actinobacteria bacterium]|nr:MAG: proteasome subunit beta [Actinomycetota bacterium]REK35519.1 MAG: proteasome subunit beta [Actinomycetota bacterium]